LFFKSFLDGLNGVVMNQGHSVFALMLGTFVTETAKINAHLRHLPKTNSKSINATVRMSYWTKNQWSMTAVPVLVGSKVTISSLRSVKR
jgi:hypothetical protein